MKNSQRSYSQDLQSCEIMMNLQEKRKMSRFKRMILQQSRFIYCSKQYGLETPSNVNIEEGESKKQLLQIGELSFRQSEVFADFGKEDYEWSDGRGTKCLVTDWLIKE
jgi:hypothetical protein